METAKQQRTDDDDDGVMANELDVLSSWDYRV